MHTIKDNYYRRLGVSQSASLEEIKKAYRLLVKQYHPDLNPRGEDEFKRITEAYQTLRDPQKRAQYDQERRFRSGQWHQTNQHSHSSSHGNPFQQNFRMHYNFWTPFTSRHGEMNQEDMRRMYQEMRKVFEQMSHAKQQARTQDEELFRAFQDRNKRMYQQMVWFNRFKRFFTISFALYMTYQFGKLYYNDIIRQTTPETSVGQSNPRSPLSYQNKHTATSITPSSSKSNTINKQPISTTDIFTRIASQDDEDEENDRNGSYDGHDFDTTRGDVYNNNTFYSEFDTRNHESTSSLSGSKFGSSSDSSSSFGSSSSSSSRPNSDEPDYFDENEYFPHESDTDDTSNSWMEQSYER